MWQKTDGDPVLLLSSKPEYLTAKIAQADMDLLLAICEAMPPAAEVFLEKLIDENF